jgi:hypothetical protein
LRDTASIIEDWDGRRSDSSTRCQKDSALPPDVFTPSAKSEHSHLIFQDDSLLQAAFSTSDHSRRLASYSGADHEFS